MSKRAIIYRRVSTDEQKKNNSPSAQDTDGRSYATAHGLTVIDSLLEDYTGTTIDRPVFNRMLELADLGAFDAVVVQHPDRLGRGPILELAIALLAKRGIEVHACNRGIISDEDDETAQIQNSVDGLVSGIERRNIRRRMQRGMVEKVTVNQQIPGYGNVAPYGYRYTGARRDRALVIHADEAQIVQQIFDWYLAGDSVIVIGDRLEALRVPRPGAEHLARGDDVGNLYHWNTATLYRMLKNPLYAGTFVAFRQAKKQTKKPLHPTPVPVPVPDLAVISPDVFQQVQEKLRTGRAVSKRNTKRLYLFRCRVTCGICGAGAIGITTTKGYSSYLCTASHRRRDRLTPCTASRFNVRDVDHTAWHWIETHVLHEENLLAAIEHKNAQTGSERAKLEEQRGYYASQIKKNEREVQRLLQAYQAEIFTLEEVAAEKQRLRDAREKLEAERLGVDHRLAALGVSDADSQYLLAKVRELREKAQHLTPEGKRQIIELCDTTIRLYKKDGARWMRIEVALTLQQDDVPIVSHLLRERRLCYPLGILICTEARRAQRS